MRKRTSAAIAALGLAGTIGVGAVGISAGFAPVAGASQRSHVGFDAGGARPGLVFTSTNAAPGNAVEVFSADGSGALSLVGTYPTGGNGTGTEVGSQGAVALSRDGDTLLVVDAGSNQVSDFAVSGSHLVLRSVVSSGGVDPTSVTIDGRYVEVLNAGSSLVSGFVATSSGLVADPSLTQPLSAGASTPEQVSFSPDGRYVVVAEKVSNTLDVFPVSPGPTLAAAVTTTSNSPNPYGFAFSPDGQLLVSNAVGGTAGASTVSRYSISGSGSLSAGQAPLPDAQTAACWLVTSADGDVYVANNGSSSISSYKVLHDGYLAFLGNTTVGTAGTTKPFDEALGSNGRELYVLDGALGQIDALRTGPDATLTTIGAFGSIPATSVGLAAS